MSTVECPLCLQEVDIDSFTYHDCPEDFPECEHHWDVWLSLANGEFDEDGDFPSCSKPSNEMVFRVLNGAPEVAGHIFRDYSGRRVGSCQCHRGIIAENRSVETPEMEAPEQAGTETVYASFATQIIYEPHRPVTRSMTRRA